MLLLRRFYPNEVTTMHTVTIVSQDRIGLMADISYILGKSRISVSSIYAEVVGEKAIIAMSVRDPEHAESVLRENGFTIIKEPVVVKLPNVPGELDRLADKLTSKNVVIEEIQEVTKDTSDGVFALNVDKPRRALKLLTGLAISPDAPIF